MTLSTMTLSTNTHNIMLQSIITHNDTVYVTKRSVTLFNVNGIMTRCIMSLKTQILKYLTLSIMPRNIMTRHGGTLSIKTA
jgi:hypothetical protein